MPFNFAGNLGHYREAATGSRILVGLSGLASQFGISLGGDATQLPQFYGQVLQSGSALAALPALCRLPWAEEELTETPGDVGLRLPEEVWLVVGARGSSPVFAEAGIEEMPERVSLTTYVSDAQLQALYAGALGLVYASLYEGFGLPPLEAMVYGTPVLTSNVTALPEVAGDAALLVDPYDTESIAEGVRRIVEDKTLREDLSRKGLERAKRFSWDRTAEQVWRVLQEAALDH